MDNRFRSKKCGATLLTAIVFALIVAIVIAVVGSMAVSSYARANVEGHYADAINLADAGMNFELHNVSRDPTDSTLAHQKVADSDLGLPGPYTGTIPGWAPARYYVR